MFLNYSSMHSMQHTFLPPCKNEREPKIIIYIAIYIYIYICIYII